VVHRPGVPVSLCPLLFSPVLWLLRLRVVKLCGLINFVACCCGACFALLSIPSLSSLILLPLSPPYIRHPLNLGSCPAAIACWFCCCCSCCCYSYGKYRTSWVLLHLVASAIIPAARSCLVPYTHPHTHAACHKLLPF